MTALPFPCIFLSTLSLRRATANGGGRLSSFDNFYPRSPCGERLRHWTTYLNCSHFYPRSPCGERPSVPHLSAPLQQFLSTLSLRRATSLLALPICPLHDFYPRSPCGERHYDNYNLHCVEEISIHALLAESDPPVMIREPKPTGFLSTLSLRRATGSNQTIISQTNDFYPRSPCGERRCTSIGRPKRLYFYPRSPCGERR